LISDAETTFCSGIPCQESDIATCCTLITPSPTSDCVARVQDWNNEIALANCETDDMGYTDKSDTAVVCSGYEDYKYRLDHSLANQVFISCSAWCVYDIYKNAYEAFHWMNTATCWKPVTSGFCIDYKNGERDEMIEYVENTLCESNTPEPTAAPSLGIGCTPYYSWDNSRAEVLCYSNYGSTDKSYGVQVCSDATSSTKQSNLEASLANSFYTQCSAWCVYDYDTIINNIQTSSSNCGGFVWKTDCWKWVTGYDCFTTHASEFEDVTTFAEKQCAVQLAVE